MKMRMAGKIKRFGSASSPNNYGFIAPLALDDESTGMVFDAKGNIIANDRNFLRIALLVSSSREIFAETTRLSHGVSVRETTSR
jgi:hypothetical protein